MESSHWQTKQSKLISHRKSLPSFCFHEKKNKSHFWILRVRVVPWICCSSEIKYCQPKYFFQMLSLLLLSRVSLSGLMYSQYWDERGEVFMNKKLFQIVPSLGNSRSFYTQGHCIKMRKKYVFCKGGEWWLWRRWWKGPPGEWGWQKTYWSWLS